MLLLVLCAIFFFFQHPDSPLWFKASDSTHTQIFNTLVQSSTTVVNMMSPLLLDQHVLDSMPKVFSSDGFAAFCKKFEVMKYEKAGEEGMYLPWSLLLQDLKWVDRHGSRTLQGKFPDFVMYDDRFVGSEMGIVAVGDLMTDDFDGEHKGRMICSHSFFLLKSTEA